MDLDTRTEMDMESLQMSRVFKLIEPGPVVLVTTNGGQKDNVMTISWTMVLEFKAEFDGRRIDRKKMMQTKLPSGI